MIFPRIYLSKDLPGMTNTGARAVCGERLHWNPQHRKIPGFFLTLGVETERIFGMVPGLKPA
jgi:hypothetical protein